MNVSKSLIIIVVLMFSTFAICDEQKSKEKKVEVDVNTYLGILIQKLDLTKDKIIIHVFNINETKIKASFSKTHLEGRIIVKTPTQVKVFVHKKWNDFQLTSIGFHKPEMLEKGQIIEYKDSLDKYIDLHGKTNLKEFLNQNKAEELYIKVIGSPYRVSPPFQNGATPSSRELEGSWQKIKLSTPEKMDKRFFKVRSAFISKIVSKNGTHEEKKLYEDSDWNDDLFENKINQSIEKKRQVCNKVLLRYFIDEGIGFSESTSLDYSARSGKLTVTNTPSNLNLLDKFLMDNDYELPQVLYFIDFLVMDEKLDHPVNLFRHGPGKYISKIFDESSIRIPTSIFGPSPVILKNQKSAIKHIQKTTNKENKK